MRPWLHRPGFPRWSTWAPPFPTKPLLFLGTRSRGPLVLTCPRPPSLGPRASNLAGPGTRRLPRRPGPAQIRDDPRSPPGPGTAGSGSLRSRCLAPAPWWGRAPSRPDALRPGRGSLRSRCPARPSPPGSKPPPGRQGRPMRAAPAPLAALPSAGESRERRAVAQLAPGGCATRVGLAPLGLGSPALLSLAAV